MLIPECITDLFSHEWWTKGGDGHHCRMCPENGRLSIFRDTPTLSILRRDSYVQSNVQTERQKLFSRAHTAPIGVYSMFESSTRGTLLRASVTFAKVTSQHTTKQRTASTSRMANRRTHQTRRRSTLCLTLLTLSVCLPPHAHAMKHEIDSRETAYERTTRHLDDQEEAIQCEATGVCEMCTDAERLIPESQCEPTGRHQHFKCMLSKGNVSDSSSESYRSCKRTEAEEEFLMVRLQAICFTIGVLSLFSVRKNRQLGAFDQRKEGKRGNILSFATISDQEQEMVPLAPSDEPLNVV